MSAAKACPRCGEVKPFGEFNRDAIKRDGRRSECRVCEAERRLERRKDPAHRAREAERERARAPRKRSREYVPEYAREWRKKNPERVRENTRRWRAQNRAAGLCPMCGSPATDGVLCAHHADANRERLRARRLKYVLPQWEDLDLWRCVYCSGPFEHVEHLHPRALGGSDDPENLVPACADCNLRKSDRPLAEWIAAEFPHIV